MAITFSVVTEHKESLEKPTRQGSAVAFSRAVPMLQFFPPIFHFSGGAEGPVTVQNCITDLRRIF